jgi:3-deoxy-D-manno-octulosonic-acid transferase
MKFAYNIIIAAAILLTSPYWIIRMGLDPSFRSEIIQRTRQWKSVPRHTGCLWVHASSVGEVRVAELLIRGMQQRFPDRPVVLSTFTATGYALAKETLECPVFRLPLDLPFLIHPLLKRLDPAILILIEAEYWPNLLHSCRQRKIPVLLANGRLSARSFARYQKLKFWFRWITEPVTTFSMRAQMEADRLLQLGIDPDRIQIAGNMKFDSITTDEAPPPESTQPNEITVVFGSTRPGEERAVAKAISQLSQNPLNYKYIIAPRHVQRCPEVESLLRDAGLSFTLHSERKNAAEAWTTPILLVDTLGALNDYYRQGHVAFVGGGFDPRHGGHNILEPALLGLPVIYGKHMGNFEEEARLLAESGGGIQIERPEDLTPALEKLLSDPQEIMKRGIWAAEVVQQQKGAVKRNLDLIQSHLEKENRT